MAWLRSRCRHRAPPRLHVPFCYPFCCLTVATTVVIPAASRRLAITNGRTATQLVHVRGVEESIRSNNSELRRTTSDLLTGLPSGLEASDIVMAGTKDKHSPFCKLVRRPAAGHICSHPGRPDCKIYESLQELGLSHKILYHRRKDRGFRTQ